mgnify:CR=1 FL=1
MISLSWQVVVIGATNRIDSIDPALRRPGRFDKEFRFSLPGEAARRKILHICTEKWPTPLGEDLLNYLVQKTSGCCGADLKHVCTEAVLAAVERTYPQLYESTGECGGSRRMSCGGRSE